MAIVELRILPPLAIGRLGSSKVPLEAFDLEVSRHKSPRLPADRSASKLSRRPEDGRAQGARAEVDSLQRRRTARSGPLAPFLEVFAVTSASPEKLVPLSTKLLEAEKLTLAAIRWTVEVGNIKAFRRTNNIKDKIVARVEGIRDHKPHELLGNCPNFLPGKHLKLGLRPVHQAQQAVSRDPASIHPRRGQGLRRESQAEYVADCGRRRSRSSSPMNW